MPVYRAEVTVWKLHPSVADLASPTTAWAGSAYFTAADDMNTFGLEVRWQRNALAIVGLSLTYTFYFNATGDPNTWTLISGTSSIEVLDEVFVFPQAITVALQKDTDADTISWVTPAGTQTRPLSGFVNDDSILRPSCHGAGIGIVGLETTDHGSTAEFRGFFGYRDAEKFIGAELSSGDPGTWGATSQYTGPSSGVFIPFTETQEVDHYRWLYTHDAPTVDHTQTRHMRCWAGGDNITEDVGFHIDAVVHPMTGTLLVAFTDPDAPEILEVLRSEDGGSTFETIMVDDNSGTLVSDPCIFVTPDNFAYVFYNNGIRGRVYYARSGTDGKTWDTAGGTNYYNVIDAFLGTPTVLVHHKFRVFPNDGAVYGFWYSESTGLLVGQRYPVVGESPSPGFFSVDSGLAPDEMEYPDLWFLARNEIFLRYKKGTDERIQSSKNWGAAWDLVEDARPTEVRQSSVSDYGSGLTFHLYQLDAPGNALYCSASEDGGDTFVAGLTGPVVSGIDPQHAALALGHRSQLYAVFWDGANIVAYVSYNLGLTWGPA